MTLTQVNRQNVCENIWIGKNLGNQDVNRFLHTQPLKRLVKTHVTATGLMKSCIVKMRIAQRNSLVRVKN